MLRLYLRDPRTQITVEAPTTKEWRKAPTTKEWRMKYPVTTVVWDLKEATAILAQAVGEKEGKPPMQVLFESAETPWEIVAKWKSDDAN